MYPGGRGGGGEGERPPPPEKVDVSEAAGGELSKQLFVCLRDELCTHTEHKMG